MESSVAGNESLVRSSIFDTVENPEQEEASVQNSPSSKKAVMWMKNPKREELLKIHHFLSDIKLYESYLIKKSRKHHKLKTRYFVLFKDRIELYEDEKKTKIKSIMFLKGVKVEFLDYSVDEKIKNSHEKFCLIFTHDKVYYILYANDANIFNEWSEHLKICCVLSYFSKYYTNLKIIGKGTFAKVILSKRNVDGKEFAVKTFDKRSLATSKNSNRSRSGLVNEIILMKILDHPNIIKLYEVYEGEYHIYLVMELLKGGELFDRIVKKGINKEKDACIIIVRLLSALEYLHELGIMHRDIKPENLILKDEHDFEIKLADFGLAEFVTKTDLLFRRCGTPGYVAPEILADKPYDTKVDVFSAGVILYILLSGASPFYGKTYNEILTKNIKCQVSYDFKEMNVKVSEDAIDLLKKLLAKEPHQRITAKEALGHPWIKKHNIKMTSLPFEDHEDDIGIEDENSRIHEKIKKMQEETRNKMPEEKPQGLLTNTPVITGRTIEVKGTPDTSMMSPMMSPNMRKDQIKSQALQTLRGIAGNTAAEKLSKFGPANTNPDKKVIKIEKVDEESKEQPKMDPKVSKASQQLKKMGI